MRFFREVTNALILCAVLLSLTIRVYAQSPVALGGQRHMFIDDMLISDKTNVTFKVHSPSLLPCSSILQEQYPWENISEYSSVIDNGLEYRIYYGNTGNLNGVCLATSTDGVTWTKPMLGVVEFNGSTQNNIVIKNPTDGGVANGSMYYDTHDPNPNRRYKYFTCQTGDDLPGTATAEGMVVYTSPDGIHFTKNEVTLLPFNADSQAVMFFDDNISKYVCYIRGSSDASGRLVVRGETDDPMQPWPYTPSPNPNMGGHEIPFVSTELPTVLKTDSGDPTGTDIYGNQAFLYPWAYKVYLAFPTCYYHYQGDRAYLSPIGPGNVGVGECQIAVSRDGVNWTRYRREPYVKHGWYDKHYCYWPWVFQGMVRTPENRIYQYIRLRPSTHGGAEFMEGEQRIFIPVSVFEQQPDRFVGANFEYTGGTMTTSPFTFDGNRLSLNVDTGGMGEGRVGILKADGTSYPGFEVGNCDIINGDWLNKTVSWNLGQNDVSSLAGKTIKLRFEMRGATLYAQQFVWAAPTMGYTHPPEQFAAAPGNGQVTLSWRNPSDSSFVGTVVRFRTDTYPASPSDGTLIYNSAAAAGSLDLFSHTGLTNGVTYYYSAFAYDSQTHYSDPSVASSAPHILSDWLDETFDNYNNALLGGQGGWSAAGGLSGQVQSSQAKGGAGKALFVDTVASGSSLGNLINVTNKTTGSILVSFDVMQDATGAVGQELAYVSIYGSTSSTEIARVRIQKGRLFVEYGPGSLATLSISAANLTWYNVKLGLNIDTRTLDLWLDGVSKGTGYAWKGTGTDVGAVIVGSDRNTNLNPQKAYIDNLRLEPKPGQVASVTDDGGWSPSLSKLHFTFPAVPGTTEYQYAIGTTSGGTQTKGWTSCGTVMDVMATGLSLTENTTSYYVSVRCLNQLGTTGTSRTSNGIKIGVGLSKIKDAKALADGTPTQVKALRGKLVSAPFSGYFYIQEPDGPFGLKAVSGAPVSAGDQVDVCGVIKGAGAERYLDGSGNGVIKATGPGGPYPMALGTAAIGGATLNSNTPGVVGGVGPNNIGLLVTVFGKVTQRQTTGSMYFYLDDGSGKKDNSTTTGADNVGVRIVADPTSYVAGSYVCVQGIVSCFSSSGLRPQILPVNIQPLAAAP